MLPIQCNKPSERVRKMHMQGYTRHPSIPNTPVPNIRVLGTAWTIYHPVHLGFVNRFWDVPVLYGQLALAPTVVNNFSRIFLSLSAGLYRSNSNGRIPVLRVAKDTVVRSLR